MTDQDIQAILGLLSDDDEAVAQVVREKLLAMGRDAILRVQAAAGPDHRARRALDGLLRRLDEPPLDAQFRTLPRTPDGDVDLEAGVFTIARFGYPRMETGECVAALDRMASDLTPRVSAEDHPIHVIRTLNAYLFEEQGFRGGVVTDPDNSFMNRVLERRTGIPITLSAVYLLVGRRLRLPLYGVGMPGHFVVKYQHGEQWVFIDPFRGGRVITRHGCREVVEGMGLPFEAGHLDATPNRHILLRMMNNLLISVYLPRGDEKKARQVMEYIQIVQGVE